jgi:hypothetical protein
MEPALASLVLDSPVQEAQWAAAGEAVTPQVRFCHYLEGERERDR